MSFDTELLAALESNNGPMDMRVALKRCFFFDFDGYPTRLWDGMGRLHAGGETWFGIRNADGDMMASIPKLQDPRDGASPRYNFAMPYIDEATFGDLKADQDLARGRELTVYSVIVKRGEGVRPSTPLKFRYRLIMQGVEFEDGIQETAPGQIQRIYGASVICRSIEAGRSLYPGGTYTDTTQRMRANLLGLESDSGCIFVAGNANRTYTFD